MAVTSVRTRNFIPQYFRTKVTLKYYTSFNAISTRASWHRPVNSRLLDKTAARHQVRVLRRKHLLSASVFQSVLLPPVVFAGLVLSLWLYKCCMMILFQNKIIYMPSIPPFSRREEIESYENSCRPIIWRERRITSSDSVNLALCVGETSTKVLNPEIQQVIILYFQGLVEASKFCTA